MLRFSIGASDAAEVQSLFEKFGILKEETPAGHDPDGEIVCRWEAVAPRDLREAIDVIRGVIFFPPRRIWLEGREYRLDDHVSGDILRIPA